MKHVIFAVLVVLVLSTACFALSEQKRQCVRTCCETYGGTYLVKNNGCENASDEEFECSMNCENEPKNQTCPGAILMGGLLGAALYLSRR